MNYTYHTAQLKIQKVIIGFGIYIGYITPMRRFSVSTKPQSGCSVTGLYHRMRGETHTLLNRTPYTPKPHPYTPEPHPYTPKPHPYTPKPHPYTPEPRSATILRRHTLLAAPLISSASVVQISQMYGAFYT